MFRTIKIAAISALLGLGTLAAAPATAQADGIYFSFGSSDARGGIHVRDHDRRDRGGWGRDHRDRDRGRWDRRDRACTPRDAVEKAHRMGLRHVQVTRANRNTIRVTGRTRHDRTSIVFARAPHCPVIRAR
ncbi:hypothetical protein [Chelativorans sp. AA-79]|uniref:hypothetical protein n=1 Tax=Chelativorans sp. AA-79 TaxID=3028735 RepID=UPI0023F658A6|nr:hypothetical protein [Chelativorans sp. AA-79]WEX11281.1 hypothetical protein PVE73_10270 [Chelativorans sp. AA-79]